MWSFKSFGKYIALIAFTALFIPVATANLPDFEGNWKLVRSQSNQIPLFDNVMLAIKTKPEGTDLCYTWGVGSRLFRDTLTFNQDGSRVSWKIHSRVFPFNVFMGIRVVSPQSVTGKVLTNNNRDSLVWEREYEVQGSQGKRKIQELDRFQITNNGNVLIWIVSIPGLYGTKEYRYVFKREGYREAYLAYLSDNWKVKESLNMQALLLSLQGLVNRDKPELYFIYPDNWDYRFTNDYYNFLVKDKDFSFTRVNDVSKLIDTFRDKISGYVVWDKDVPVTLDIAFTLAGLNNAIVISGDLIPFAQNHGLRMIKDLRGIYGGMDDSMVFRKAYDAYGDLCNKDMIVWLGGESGEVIKPGIADWGVANHTFFTNLSTDPADSSEYSMADEIMGNQNPLGIIFGWHVYNKDKERDYVRLASSHALRVEGLHTLPNLSFMHHVPVPAGYQFRNNHSTPLALNARPEKKIYISFVQTDCLGLGAWNQPGRGSIPYAWEVTMNWYWLAPSLLEYFYSQATDKDYFIGSLSGPGYMYPKAVPERYLPLLIDSAYNLMKKLDLDVFEIMDYSEGATIEGNTELTRKVVDTYFERMPGCIGFLNGYAPAFSFYSKQGRPLVSFDYYLDPDRSVEDAIRDIKSLASLNRERPYFLLVHVRQWNNIDKVQQIFAGAGEDFKVIPLDIFLRMAGTKITFRESLLSKTHSGR
jgi:hypothetical protein